MVRMQLRYLPNIITSARFALIIPVLWALFDANYRLALYLFLCASISDSVDGLLARICGWTSTLGALLDPLADKLLLMTNFTVLAYQSQIPLPLALMVIGRDLWIMLGAVAYQYCIGPLHYQPMLVSKLNTFLQFLWILLVLVNLGFTPLPPLLLTSIMGLVVATTVISFVQYTWVWGKRAIDHFRLGVEPKKGH